MNRRATGEMTHAWNSEPKGVPREGRGVGMQFLVIAHDGDDPDAMKRRMAAREAHLRLGDQMRDRGELLYGVAILDEDERMVGSVYVLDFPSREELNAWLEVEPYVTGRVWERTEIRPCRVGPSFAK